MEQPQVNLLQKDVRFEGYLLVRSAEQRAAGNGSRYLDMTLSDRTGDINAKLWDGAFSPPVSGTVVKVRGMVQEYNGRLQMRVERMRDSEEQDGIDISLLTPCAPLPPEAMLLTIDETIERMENEDLKKLLRVLIDDIREQLVYFPAAQKLHHAERSGLLHHTTDMLRTAEALLPCYPWLNGDLVRAGVIIHDLSKIGELDSDSLGNVRDYTADGLLLGHLVRGVSNVARAAEKAGVTGELPMLLEHMVISHHGIAEHGSPRMPMFPEAEMLHWIDLLDARMNEMESVQKRTPPGAFSEKIWSLERRMYHPKYDAALGASQED